MSVPATKPEHPLANLLVNVIVPVLALSHLSKTGDKLWNLGPRRALAAALILPVAYGIRHFIVSKKLNVFSLVGFISVLLTGGLTVYLWNADGTIKPNAVLLFGIKEASIPFVLGLCVLVSHRTPTPLLRMFLYTDALFDVAAIEAEVDERNERAAYDLLLWQSTLCFAASFLVSMALTPLVARHFLGGIDPHAANATELFSAGVAKVTAWAFGVVGVPMLAFLSLTFWRLLKGLRHITGFDDDKLMLPR
jgi:hypothetical protein